MFLIVFFTSLFVLSKWVITWIKENSTGKTAIGKLQKSQEENMTEIKRIQQDQDDRVNIIIDLIRKDYKDLITLLRPRFPYERKDEE